MGINEDGQQWSAAVRGRHNDGGVAVGIGSSATDSSTDEPTWHPLGGGMGSNFAEPEAKNSGVAAVVPAGSTQYHDSKDSTDKYLDHPPLRKNLYHSNTGF